MEIADLDSLVLFRVDIFFKFVEMQLHCLGVLLDRSFKTEDLSTGVKDTTALVSNLIIGLQLPKLVEIKANICIFAFQYANLF